MSTFDGASNSVTAKSLLWEISSARTVCVRAIYIQCAFLTWCAKLTGKDDLRLIKVHLEFSGREVLIGLEPEVERCLLARAHNPVLLLQGAMNMIACKQGSSACLLISASVPPAMRAKGLVQSPEAAKARHAARPAAHQNMTAAASTTQALSAASRQVATQALCKPGLQPCRAACLPGSAGTIVQQMPRAIISQHLSSEILEVLAESLCVVQGPSQHGDIDGR